MKIVVLDRYLGKVYYVDVDETLVKNDDVDGWLKDRGYDPKVYPYFRTDVAKYVPIEFCRFIVGKNGVEHRNHYYERLRYASPYYREKDLKRREYEECVDALRKNGEEIDGGFEVHFEADKPIVAGYLYDEPCDLVVNAIRMKDDEIYILCYDKNDTTTEQEVSATELFAGQLNEITEMI